MGRYKPVLRTSTTEKICRGQIAEHYTDVLIVSVFCHSATRTSTVLPCVRYTHAMMRAHFDMTRQIANILSMRQALRKNMGGKREETVRAVSLRGRRGNKQAPVCPPSRAMLHQDGASFAKICPGEDEK